MAANAASGSANPVPTIIDLFTNSSSDTQYFVALTLLKSVLDTRPDIRNDPSQLHSIWSALPHVFLRRLINTPSSRNEASSLVSLGVSAVSIFATITTDELSSPVMVAYVVPVVKALPGMETAVQARAYAALGRIIGTREGASAFLGSKESKEMIAILAKDEWHVGQICSLLSGVRDAELTLDDIKVWDTLVTMVLSQAGGYFLQVFELLRISFDRGKDVNYKVEPPWLSPTLKIIRDRVMKHARVDERNQFVLFAGTLLRSLPSDLKFANKLYLGGMDPSDFQHSTFAHLFVILLLADIESTIPNLMSRLTSSQYPNDALRLALSYDLIGAFLSLLLQMLGDESDESDEQWKNLIPIDSLLKFRSNLGQVLSVTIEYLGDRWNASHGGAPGLHSSARAPKPGVNLEPLPLTWDNLGLPISKDPFTLSALRVLSIWISEDGSTLQQELASIMDALLFLYAESIEPDTIDCRSPILDILPYLFWNTDSNTIDSFLEHDGWLILSRDFSESLESPMTNRGEQILWALQIVVQSDHINASREGWMQMIFVLSQLDLNQEATKSLIFSALSLANELYEKAPKRLQKLYEADLQNLSKKAGACRIFSVDGEGSEVRKLLGNLAMNGQ